MKKFICGIHCEWLHGSLVPATNQYLALYTPTRVSADVSGNKSLPDPIPYPLFLETIKGLRYSTFPGLPTIQFLIACTLQKRLVSFIT